MIPIYINDKSLYEIFDPTTFNSKWDDEELQQRSIDKQMFPSEIALVSETYSRDAERTADYELENLTLVNRKAKIEVIWSLVRADYIANLMRYLDYKYDFKNASGTIIPADAPAYLITYYDFIGARSMRTYLAQTVEGTLVEYDNVLYWQNLRIAFPER